MSAAPSPFLNYSGVRTHTRTHMRSRSQQTTYLQLCRTQITGYSHNMFQVLQSAHWYNTNFLPCFNHTFYFSKQIICSVLAKQYILVYTKNGKIYDNSIFNFLTDCFLRMVSKCFYTTFIFLVSDFFIRSKYTLRVLLEAN